MRKSIKVQWPKKKNNSVLNTVKNYMIGKNNLGTSWWFNEVTICEAEQSLDLQEANKSLIYTNWDFYVSTKGWMV
jgi:hypothetical protein